MNYLRIGSRLIEILGRKWNFLTRYIFCKSRRDESTGGIKSEFFYLEHLKKFLKFEKIDKVVSLELYFFLNLLDNRIRSWYPQSICLVEIYKKYIGSKNIGSKNWVKIISGPKFRLRATREPFKRCQYSRDEFLSFDYQGFL